MFLTSEGYARKDVYIFLGRGQPHHMRGVIGVAVEVAWKHLTEDVKSNVMHIPAYGEHEKHMAFQGGRHLALASSNFVSMMDVFFQVLGIFPVLNATLYGCQMVSYIFQKSEKQIAEVQRQCHCRQHFY